MFLCVSAGKKEKGGHNKIGNVHLKWAFSEGNDCKVYKLTVLNHSYFIVKHAGKQYIRKSSAGVNGLMKSLGEKG